MPGLWPWGWFEKLGRKGKRFPETQGPAVDSGNVATVQDWQSRAWDLWDCVGELHSPTSYIANVIATRMLWSIGELDDEKSMIEIQELLGNTDISEFVRLNLLNYQVNGETWILYFEDENSFDVRSCVDPNLKKLLEKATSFRRVYQAHPRDPELAECAMRTVLDPAEELSVLSALSRSQSRSRIANVGVWLYPQQQQTEGGNPFQTTLPMAMTAAIKNVNSPAAWAPIVHTMDEKLIEKVRHIAPAREFDDQLSTKIDKAITRIALGLDIPPELLMGMASSSNHWGAWISQEETVNGSVLPLSDVMVSIFQWIWLLRNYGDLTKIPDDAFSNIPEIRSNPKDILARRSTVRDAIDGAKIGAVGLEFVRDAIGADEKDKPSDEDLKIITTLLGKSMPGDEEEKPVDETRDAPNEGNPERSEETETEPEKATSQGNSNG